MTLKQRLGSLWISVRYNPIAEWHFERKLQRQGWRAKAWINTEPDNFGILALVMVGNVVDDDGKPTRSSFDDLVRWATCAVETPDVLDHALRIVEPMVEFGPPAEPPDGWAMFRDGYSAERAVAVLSAARERLAFLDA